MSLVVSYFVDKGAEEQGEERAQVHTAAGLVPGTLLPVAVLHSLCTVLALN